VDRLVTCTYKCALKYPSGLGDLAGAEGPDDGREGDGTDE